jgi:hypothetical protein
MSEPATEYATTVVPPLGHFLWVYNLGDGEQWVTQTEENGRAFFIRIAGHQVVCYGPFERRVEFGCALSPAIGIGALAPGDEPTNLPAGAEVFRLEPLDPPAP